MTLSKADRRDRRSYGSERCSDYRLDGSLQPRGNDAGTTVNGPGGHCHWSAASQIYGGIATARRRSDRRNPATVPTTQQRPKALAARSLAPLRRLVARP